jgi:hypothetical protein
MKTRIATLAILLGLFITSTAFANEPVPASKAVASSIADLIEEELEYPDYAIEEKFQGDVVMEIVIEEDGTLDVVAANSVDQKMKNLVALAVEEIETEKFANYAGQTLLVKVSYDLRLY